MKTNKQANVVRVTRTEFELDDGRIYEHPLELDGEADPTVEDFQKFYDFWQDVIGKHVEEAD